MDIGAYLNISQLQDIADKNGIIVPRLRGYRLMSQETPIELADNEQSITFNSYVGRDDVLYVHARIGGGNWETYRDEVENQPWFIEKVDDAYDSTYCDIYCRIRR